ncbi:MAG TPA: hypothetical protein VFG23_00500 [Polyangia bacterium]|nr:hypothetical protein [Polyangia bacterium]
MTTKTIERFVCDVGASGEISDDGAMNWAMIRLRVSKRDGGSVSEEKHLCPKHDKTPFGELVVGMKLDTNRLIGALTP